MRHAFPGRAWERGKIEKTTQAVILGLIKINPAITRKGLAEKTGLTPDGVKYHLDKLREQGVVGKWWRITSEKMVNYYE